VNKDERIAQLRERLERIEDRTARIWAKNDFVDFPVYRAPTDLLLLNPSNRRFRAEAQQMEHDLGRALDPLASTVDEQSIIALLLDRDPHIDNDRVVGSRNKDTDALIADWHKRHQESPLWIRPDGLVSNGNRRLAMLKRLQAERGKEGYDWVDVIVLDEETYDDETLFEMEAREQLTEGLKVRYTELNLLLTLKDAAEKLEIDWHDRAAIEGTANRIQDLVGNDPRYAKVQLQAIKAMIDYLDWVGHPGEFSRLRGMVERFRDVGKNVAWVATQDPTREVEMLELCFQAIAAGARHPDLREIRRMLKSDSDSFDSLVRTVESIADEDGAPDEEEPVVPDSEDEDDDDVDEEDDVEDVPETHPRSPKHEHILRAIDIAVETSQRARKQDELADVRLAAASLKNVDPASLLAAAEGGELDRLREAVRVIVAWAAAAEQAMNEAAGEG
jgi:hypothetical protein